LFTEIYIPNGYVDIIIPNLIKKNNSLFGDKILSFLTPIGYEIDTIDEFEYIEYRILKYGTKLFQYLRGIKND
jgi:hypothetical protein